MADFGLAWLMVEEKTQPRDLRSLKKPDRKKQYMVLGHPSWMVPEMINGEWAGPTWAGLQPPVPSRLRPLLWVLLWDPKLLLWVLVSLPL